jgi:hypothetical protein
MYRNAADLFIVMLLAVAAAICAAVPIGENLARAALALPLVFVLPGYAATAAVFPKMALDSPERLALIPGLSIAFAILGGLVLNLTPWGLQTVSWSVLLSGTTLIAGTIAVARRQRQPRIAVRRATSGLDMRQGALAGLSILMVGVALGVSSSGAAQQQTPGFTQLWLLPGRTQSHRMSVRLGLHSVWSTKTRYRLELLMGQSSHSHVVHAWPSVVLKPGSTWLNTISVPASNSGPIQANLYLLDERACHKRATRPPGRPTAECASNASSIKVYRRVFLYR